MNSTRLGQYDLLAPLGKGGMGTVYRAVNRESGATVAIKLISSASASNPLLLRRFEQEGQAASRLIHPNIVRGLDFGIEEGRPYLVMELVEGGSLGQQVFQQGYLAPARVVRIAQQIGSALDLAHQHQLIHRDVKPENILLGADGQAKLADLGLVKDLNAEDVLTKSGTWLGSITYMAPEQFGDARHARGSCDVYGLGASLYYAFTGVAPFSGGNLTVLGQKLKGDFKPPSQLLPSLAKQIDTALARALDPEPTRRPTSCAELASLLPAFDEGPAPAAPAAPQPVASRQGDSEKRRSKRYPAKCLAACRPLRAGEKRWLGEVRDVSLTGIQLQIDRRFEPGTVLELEVTDSVTELPSTFLVRACWAREIAARCWALGCAFGRPIQECDLELFLGEKSCTVVVNAKN